MYANGLIRVISNKCPLVSFGFIPSAALEALPTFFLILLHYSIQLRNDKSACC